MIENAYDMAKELREFLEENESILRYDPVKLGFIVEAYGGPRFLIRVEEL